MLLAIQLNFFLIFKIDFVFRDFRFKLSRKYQESTAAPAPAHTYPLLHHSALLPQSGPLSLQLMKHLFTIAVSPKPIAI